MSDHPGIIAKASGTFEVRYRIDGVQGGRTFDTLQDAKHWQAKGRKLSWERALELLETPGADVAPTVYAFAVHHIEHLTSVNDDTRRDYRLAADAWPPYIADMPLPGLTTDLVARWVNAQRSAGMSGKTIANRHSLLSNVLTAAVAAGHMPTNPAKGMRLPRTEAPSAVFLTEQQVAAIVSELDPWWHALVWTMFGTGMRYGEVTALHWSHVALTGRDPSVRIDGTWKQAPGGSLIGPPKTRKSRRTVGIGDGVVRLLVNHRQAQPPRPCGCRLEAGHPMPSGGLVFTTPAGYRVADRFRDDTWREVVARALPDLDPAPTPHDVRHSHASLLIARGVPLPVVQARLGHEKISTTVDVYGHLQLDTLRQGAAAGDVGPLALEA